MVLIIKIQIWAVNTYFLNIVANVKQLYATAGITMVK
jgi:hypothetical protein